MFRAQRLAASRNEAAVCLAWWCRSASRHWSTASSKSTMDARHHNRGAQSRTSGSWRIGFARKNAFPQWGLQAKTSKMRHRMVPLQSGKSSNQRLWPRPTPTPSIQNSTNFFPSVERAGPARASRKPPLQTSDKHVYAQSLEQADGEITAHNPRPCSFPFSCLSLFSLHFTSSAADHLLHPRVDLQHH